MVRLFIAIAMLVIPLHASAEAETVWFRSFEMMVQEAAARLPSHPTVWVNVNPDVFRTAKAPAHVYKRLDGTYAVMVLERFIAVPQDPLVLQHIAEHEVCHIKLGHAGEYIAPAWPGEPERDIEDEAERCVYDIVGEETYVDMFANEMRHDLLFLAAHPAMTRSEIKAGVHFYFANEQ